MTPDGKPATIYDVARLAGVSHQTVTRVLGGFAGIRPATRERVEAAIAELDYRPNRAARLLRTNRSNRIGALVHEMTENGPSTIVLAAGRRAHERGYLLDIVSLEGFGDDAVREALTMLEHERVAGILATAPTERMRALFADHVGSVPLIVGTREPNDPFDAGTGRVAAELLLRLGHRSALAVRGPLGWITAEQRQRGFVDAFESGGGRVVTVVGDWSPASAHRVVAEPGALDGVTAVFAHNDHMALGAIRAAADQGLRVPADLSVVGVDDLPEGRYLSPSLTTVPIDFDAEGRRTIDALIARIEGTDDAAPAPSALRVIERESTAPPRV